MKSLTASGVSRAASAPRFLTVTNTFSMAKAKLIAMLIAPRVGSLLVMLKSLRRSERRYRSYRAVPEHQVTKNLRELPFRGATIELERKGPQVTDYAKWLRDLSVFMDTHSMNDENVSQKLLMAAGEIDRLCDREADLKNVLRHALYNEPNGVDLVQRMTTFAITQRKNS